VVWGLLVGVVVLVEEEEEEEEEKVTVSCMDS
jgi:hypothetical protein